jgi:prolyl 4-hydroxylase
VAKGESTISDYRITQICFFQRSELPVIQAIERRISELSRMPLENFEGVQYGLYNKGGYYKHHYDFADPAWGGGVSNFLNRGGQRVLTFLMYLNTLQPDDGGATVFPNNNPQLTFTPTQGMCLVFYNVETEILEDGTPQFSDKCDYSSGHEATPILKDGVQKHIATQWVREKVFI